MPYTFDSEFKKAAASEAPFFGDLNAEQKEEKPFPFITWLFAFLVIIMLFSIFPLFTIFIATVCSCAILWSIFQWLVKYV